MHGFLHQLRGFPPFSLLPLLALLILAPLPAVAVEEPQYQVLAEREAFDVRQYAPMRLAVYEVDGDFESAGNKAFRPLLGYITGSNASDTDYAMTAPVTQRPSGERWQVAFILPAEAQLKDLPAPTNARVRIIEQPATTLAVARYSGTWSQQRFQAQEQALREALIGSAWTPCGDAVWARYNGPFTPWFMRRNEVQVPVAMGTCDG